MKHLTKLTHVALSLSAGRVVNMWDVTCSCGWESAPQASRKLAAGAAAAHRAAADARESES